MQNRASMKQPFPGKYSEEALENFLPWSGLTSLCAFMSEFLLHAVELLPNGKNGLRSTSARKVRAAEIRAQRLDRAQACGETAVHAPQSRAAGSGGVAGTVELDQLPRLLVW